MAVVAIAWLLWRYRPFRVEVRGRSMDPTLSPGEWAVAVGRGPYRLGDVVVLEHPGRPGFEMVKRVVSEANGRYGVEGDNPGASTDSRVFGPVDRSALKGRVVAVYWPPSAMRVVARAAR